MKKGDKVLCIKQLYSTYYNYHSYYEKDKIYTITGIMRDVTDDDNVKTIAYEISDQLSFVIEPNKTGNNSFDEYFISIKELRKQKIKNLYDTKN